MSNCKDCCKIFCIYRDKRENCTEIIRFSDQMIKEIDKRAEEHSERYREDIIENIQNGVLEIKEKGEK